MDSDGPEEERADNTDEAAAAESGNIGADDIAVAGAADRLRIASVRLASAAAAYAAAATDNLGLSFADTDDRLLAAIEALTDDRIAVGNTDDQFLGGAADDWAAAAATDDQSAALTVTAVRFASAAADFAAAARAARAGRFRVDPNTNR